MADQAGAAGSGDHAAISEAFAAARELLSRAHDDAAEVRAAADRYVRQREAEAELLVAKARRVLAAAEARSSTMRRAPAPPAASADEPDLVIDLDALAASPAAAEPVLPAPARRSVRPVVEATRSEGADGFDGILASAVSRAVDRALTPEP